MDPPPPPSGTPAPSSPRARDVPFGERYWMKMTYYKVSEQPLFYKHSSPFDVACSYPANAYW